MTPEAFRHIRTLLKDEEHHVRTVSGDLHTGKISAGSSRDFIEMEIANRGSDGSHFIWIAIDQVESIEERS